MKLPGGGKSQFDFEVIVVGAGPAGLAAAIAARRFGFKTLIVDALRPPIDKACGEGLLPRAVAAALRLGIRIPLALGCDFRGIRFADSGHSVTADFPDGAGFGIRRTALHAALAQCAAERGVEASWGHALSSIESHRIRLGGSGVSARWIIGADGAKSRVRGWAGLSPGRSESRRYGFRRHYRVAAPPERVEIHWSRDCQTYATPVAGDAVCLAVLSTNPRLRISDALGTFPELASMLGAPSQSPLNGGVWLKPTG